MIGFKQLGEGMTIQFRCGKCGRASPSCGSGVRHVMGLRTRVCTNCKHAIDARRKKPA